MQVGSKTHKNKNRHNSTFKDRKLQARFMQAKTYDNTLDTHLNKWV